MIEFSASPGACALDRIRTALFSAAGMNRAFDQRDSDEMIVAHVLKSKDPAPFSFIVTRYRTKLSALARTTLAGSAAAGDVDDVVQDTFVSAYDRLTSFRGDAVFRPWLYRILLNKCMDRLRSARFVDDSSNSPEPSTTGPDPLTSLINSEQAKRIDAAVQTLAPGQRAVFLLRHLDNLSYAELAQITGQPEGTVKSHLFRARARVRELLKDDDQ